MKQIDKEQAYKKSIKELRPLLKGENNRIAKMATINCILKDNFPYYFWTGFYLVENGELIVGPYQGTLGCLHIKFGRGVCGTSAASRKTVVVPDVHKFPGHIACDSRSNSEIVVPVFAGKKLIAVFDVDSVSKNSFNVADQKYLESLFSEFF